MLKPKELIKENAYSASLFQLLNIYLNDESITLIYKIYNLSYLHLLIAVKGNSLIALSLIFFTLIRNHSFSSSCFPAL